MTDPDQHEFGTGPLRAAVLAQGAELCALTARSGLDLLWPAAPAWPRHAPVLFPIVGRLKDDRLQHEGRVTTLTQHGFARDFRFAWAERTDSGCTLTLTESEATLARYPFPFRLELGYRVEGAALTVTTRVHNPGAGILPVSFGAHPAFRWPIEPGRPKEDYALIFDQPEPDALRRVQGGLLTAADRKSPVRGRELRLADALFAEDALIWEAPRSHGLRYAAADGPALTFHWRGYSQLGVWSRAGADFVCIEPWQGMASPADFDGPFMGKPWLRHIPPGGTESAAWTVSVQI